MLREGFHKSFAELFALIKTQNGEREKAGPESVLWNQALLEDEHNKLDMLREQLCLAEKALRRGGWDSSSNCLLTIKIENNLKNKHERTW